MRGQAAVEFALCFLLFMAVVFGFAQIALTIWMKSTLHFAAREGVRFAITGRTLDGAGHDDSIKQVVRRQAAGLLSADQADHLITIQYYDATGSPTNANAAGNTIVLAINHYPVPTLTGKAISLVAGPMEISTSAVGRQEPYPQAPPR